jgi:hypothetical protein
VVGFSLVVGKVKISMEGGIIIGRDQNDRRAWGSVGVNIATYIKVTKRAPAITIIKMKGYQDSFVKENIMYAVKMVCKINIRPIVNG